MPGLKDIIALSNKPHDDNILILHAVFTKQIIPYVAEFGRDGAQNFSKTA